MGEQCDGEFLTAACSNSAQKCLKTVWYFSEMFRRKNPVWKMSSSTNCYIIIYWPFTEYPRHASVRQETQYMQLSNTEQENKNHQANLLAWLKWEAFLALKKIHPTSYCSKYCFFTDFRKEFAHLEQLVRARCPCQSFTKAFPANRLSANKPEAARGWGSGVLSEEHTARATLIMIWPSWCLSNTIPLWMEIFSKEMWRTHVVCFTTDRISLFRRRSNSKP